MWLCDKTNFLRNKYRSVESSCRGKQFTSGDSFMHFFPSLRNTKFPNPDGWYGYRCIRAIIGWALMLGSWINFEIISLVFWSNMLLACIFLTDIDIGIFWVLLLSGSHQGNVCLKPEGNICSNEYFQIFCQFQFFICYFSAEFPELCRPIWMGESLDGLFPVLHIFWVQQLVFLFPSRHYQHKQEIKKRRRTNNDSSITTRNRKEKRKPSNFQIKSDRMKGRSCTSTDIEIKHVMNTHLT